ncbi:ParB/RepB/Spo0J family partition protein [Burkholderia anthina]|uniref:ParB/RepB/Spo0J family partition protein n=1 Tax=Burkholderia anthina TaxID=179879 RepID=UPI0037BF801B
MKNVFANSIKRASSVQQSIDARATGVDIPQLIAPSRIRVKAQIRGPKNPGFRPESLKALAADIKANGQLQPAIVVRDPEGISEFLLVAGERRYRACEIGGMDLLATIKDLTAKQARRVQIAENIEREDLTPAELAAAVKDDYAALGTLELVAELWGKSINWIHERLKFVEALDAGGVAAEAVNAGVTADISTVNELAKLEKRDPAAAKRVVSAAKADPNLNVRQAARSAIKEIKQAAAADVRVGGQEGTEARDATFSQGFDGKVSPAESRSTAAPAGNAPGVTGHDADAESPREDDSAGIGARLDTAPGVPPAVQADPAPDGDAGDVCDPTVSIETFARAAAAGEAALVRKRDGHWIAGVTAGVVAEKFDNLEDLLQRLAAVGLTKVEVECPVAFA